MLGGLSGGGQKKKNGRIRFGTDCAEDDEGCEVEYKPVYAKMPVIRIGSKEESMLSKVDITQLIN